jgi:hypothetical protein
MSASSHARNPTVLAGSRALITDGLLDRSRRHVVHVVGHLAPALTMVTSTNGDITVRSNSAEKQG